MASAAAAASWSIEGKHVAFCLTYASHAAVHACRKSFAAAYSELEDDWEFSSDFLGLLDTLLMLFYGIGLFLNGYLAERINPVKQLAVGLALSGSMLLLFASSAALGAKGDGAYAWYTIVVVFWAILQSVSMPCGVQIVSTWFKGHSGKVFGWWTTSSVVGNLVGLGIASIYTGTEGDRALVPMLMTPAAIQIAIAALVILFVTTGGHVSDRKPLTSNQVLKIPQVVTYTSAFVGVKSVDTSLFFWIVLFLHEQLDLSETASALMAMLYDFGVILGAITVGYITDMVGTRSGVFTAVLIATGCILIVVGWLENVGLVGFLILLTGIGLGGPFALMPTAIAADISRRSGKKVAASVVGIIDGTASVCSAFSQLAIGFANGRVEWGVIFCVLAAMLFISATLTLSIYLFEPLGKGIPVSESEGDDDEEGGQGLDEGTGRQGSAEEIGAADRKYRSEEEEHLISAETKQTQ